MKGELFLIIFCFVCCTSRIASSVNESLSTSNFYHKYLLHLGIYVAFYSIVFSLSLPCWSTLFLFINRWMSFCNNWVYINKILLNNKFRMRNCRVSNFLLKSWLLQKAIQISYNTKKHWIINEVHLCNFAGGSIWIICSF